MFATSATTHYELIKNDFDVNGVSTGYFMLATLNSKIDDEWRHRSGWVGLCIHGELDSFIDKESCIEAGNRAGCNEEVRVVYVVNDEVTAVYRFPKRKIANAKEWKPKGKYSDFGSW